jgi:MFS family permease
MGSSFRSYLFALFVFTLGNSTDAFLLLKLTDAGVSVKWVPVLWSLHHVVKAVCTYGGGALSDRMGRRGMVWGGWGVYALVYLAFSAIKSPVWVVAIFMVYGIYFGLTEPVEKAWVADLAPRHLRGAAFGWYHGVVGLGALPASLLFGWIWKVWSPSCAFLTGATFAAVAAALLLKVPNAVRET